MEEMKEEIGNNQKGFISLNIQKEKADCYINIRLTSEQKKLLNEYSEKNNMTMTNYILSRTLFSNENMNSVFNKDECLAYLNTQKAEKKADVNLFIRLTKTQKTALTHNASVAGITITDFILSTTLFSRG